MKKTILITGSTDGIGKLAAIKLAKDGHEIYVHGRNAKKLSVVIAEIKEQSNNDNVNGFIADFSDMAAVKSMADQINQEVSKLDVLINNAGVFKSAVSMTKDNWDIRFAVNYFAPYLLTNELLPLLSRGEASRIINLSSAAQASVSLEALAGNVQLSAQAAYAQSKLALTMWSFHLSRVLPDLNIIAVNPGSLLNTKMVKEGFGFHRSSADKGRDVLYDLAVSEKHENATGKYFDNDRGAYGPASHDAYNEKQIDRLISETKTILHP